MTSHDHLDTATTRHLAGHGTRFYAPLRIGAHAERWNVTTARIAKPD
ncbi:MAG: hypothetical protein V2J24_00565 [Pseudomonadales bacterium]|nr:hypothetical protein [Pseudomonadales bacterium]